MHYNLGDHELQPADLLEDTAWTEPSDHAKPAHERWHHTGHERQCPYKLHQHPLSIANFVGNKLAVALNCYIFVQEALSTPSVKFPVVR